jgi:DNA-directed RNA polymerase specialized sigma24 family protein
VEQYWNMVILLIRTKNTGPTGAEDVAQESFLKAYSPAQTLQKPFRFAGWLAVYDRNS